MLHEKQLRASPSPSSFDPHIRQRIFTTRYDGFVANGRISHRYCTTWLHPLSESTSCLQGGPTQLDSWPRPAQGIRLAARAMKTLLKRPPLLVPPSRLASP